MFLIKKLDNKPFYPLNEFTSNNEKYHHHNHDGKFFSNWKTIYIDLGKCQVYLQNDSCNEKMSTLVSEKYSND